MDKVVSIIAKSSFQLHGATASGEPVIRRKLPKSKLLEFLAKQPVCQSVMEGCGGAHHWGRMTRGGPRREIRRCRVSMDID